MTPTDLDRIERELGIRLPANYRALVLDYPAALGPSGPDYELLDDPQQLIEINRLYRAQGFFGMPWPEHFYSIGGDGSGNDYYLDLRLDQSPVYFADHEGSIYSEEWPSLDAWLAERVKEQAEWVEEERQRKERKAHKKWWQFWIVLVFALLHPAGVHAQPKESGPSNVPCADPQRVLRQAVFDLEVGRARLRDGRVCLDYPQKCEWEVTLRRAEVWGGAPKFLLVSLLANHQRGTGAWGSVFVYVCEGSTFLPTFTGRYLYGPRTVDLGSGADFWITAGVWKPDDPTCCPSQEQRQHYVWEPARKQFFVRDASVRPLSK